MVGGIYGWIGKILRINLTTGETLKIDTMDYAEKYIGGRGIAAKIAWDEIQPGTDAFDPKNRLMFITGPLAGTLAPSSGRVEVCGIAAQNYPTPSYTRSCMGGHWGAELKYAGYDGVVIQGKASSPVYIWIRDGDVKVESAHDLWGTDSFEAQRKIEEEKGKGTQTASIGPAGEKLVRIAVIQTGIENAAGQGGFGAVMGSKNLKAIAVRGTGAVGIAKPKRLLEAAANVARIAYVSSSGCESPRTGPQPPSERRPGSRACTISCKANCLQVHKTANDVVVGVQCCSGSYLALKPHESALETALAANKLGLNHWELVNGFRGKYGWLPRCEKAGVLKDEDFDMPFRPVDADFWRELIRKIAYREGVGDLLAEGWVRAADRMGKGREYVPHVAHGYQTHWDGHLYGAPRYPYWLVSALTWITDSRDPLVHGYASRLTGLWQRFADPSTRKDMLAISRKVYGSEKAVDPNSGYEWKAQPTIWNQNRDAVKDSLILCDTIFPMHFTSQTQSSYGDTEAEAKLYSAATGIEVDEAALDRAGERIFNLERAIMVREGRTRNLEEGFADYFRQPDYEGVSMDWRSFQRLLDEYYELRGWEKTTGRPRRRKLEELGLNDVADELEVLTRG